MIELRYISDYYGTRIAERSKLPLINHIHEGLAVLRVLGASDFAQRAWCMHPLYQADKDLALNYKRSVPGVPAQVILLAMEYRNQANAWLSDKVWDNGTYSYSDDIPRLVVEQFAQDGNPSPGPLPEVRDMLIADKVQNFKDFLAYQRGHQRYKELDLYFRTWLNVLGVSSKDVISYFDAIDIDKKRREQA